MTTISQLARETREHFTTTTRPGENEAIYVTKVDAPEWVQDFLREAHGTEMLPDDWRYDAIVSALDRIDEVEVDSEDDLDDEAHEYADAQVSVYNHNRHKWLSSHLSRSGYVDQARESGLIGPDADINDQIGLGQYEEATEIWHNVVRALTNRLEEIENDA